MEGDLGKLGVELTEMKKIQDNLARNISELHKTAKLELDRKDRTIADLRSQLDNLIFKRNTGGIKPENKRRREDTPPDKEVKKPKLTKDTEKEIEKHDRNKGSKHEHNGRSVHSDKRRRSRSRSRGRDRRERRSRSRSKTRNKVNLDKRDYSPSSKNPKQHIKKEFKNKAETKKQVGTENKIDSSVIDLTDSKSSESEDKIECEQKKSSGPKEKIECKQQIKPSMSNDTVEHEQKTKSSEHKEKNECKQKIKSSKPVEKIECEQKDSVLSTAPINAAKEVHIKDKEKTNEIKTTAVDIPNKIRASCKDKIISHDTVEKIKRNEEKKLLDNAKSIVNNSETHNTTVCNKNNIIDNPKIKKIEKTIAVQITDFKQTHSNSDKQVSESELQNNLSCIPNTNVINMLQSTPDSIPNSNSINNTLQSTPKSNTANKSLDCTANSNAVNNSLNTTPNTSITSNDPPKKVSSVKRRRCVISIKD